MARTARVKSRTGIYHVMLRGINKQTIFEDEEDKYKFLETLKTFEGFDSYKFFAYCFMNNHVHILIQEVKDEISTAIKRISSSYVFWYNKKYERCGHLFQERFKSEVIESEGYFLTVLRYIHQNPIKAGIVEKIEDYNWTSYGEYISKGSIVNVDLALDLLSSNREEAVRLFTKYHKEENSDKCLDYENFIKLTDDKLKEDINRLGIINIKELQSIDKNSRNQILRKLKNIEGASIRQLSRITGISKSVIERA